MSDIVIQFYELIVMLVKIPDDKRKINWKLKFFNKRVNEILNGNENDVLCADVVQMAQELALCQRRRCFRRLYYNLSEIDEVYASYRISHSNIILNNAWNLFRTETYKIAEVNIYA